MEIVRHFIFWAPKSLQAVTAALKIKRHLFLGRKVMTKLDSILKSRDINLPTKVHLVKAMVFPVVMYETTQRDGIGRQEGWGFRMGNMCTPVADSC